MGLQGKRYQDRLPGLVTLGMKPQFAETGTIVHQRAVMRRDNKCILGMAATCKNEPQRQSSVRLKDLREKK